jgi:hypothetical protein
MHSICLLVYDDTIEDSTLLLCVCVCVCVCVVCVCVCVRARVTCKSWWCSEKHKLAGSVGLLSV